MKAVAGQTCRSELIYHDMSLLAWSMYTHALIFSHFPCEVFLAAIQGKLLIVPVLPTCTSQSHSPRHISEKAGPLVPSNNNDPFLITTLSVSLLFSLPIPPEGCARPSRTVITGYIKAIYHLISR